MTDIAREWAGRARKAQEAINELGAGPPASRLADDDQELVARAREVGAELRRRPGDLDRLAGWLLAELADREAAPAITDADRRLVTRARELAAARGADALRVIAGRPGTDGATVHSEALGAAQYLLGELAAIVERLDGRAAAQAGGD